MLDVIAERSRGALLAGEQLICLVQSSDPRLTLPLVGAIPPWWNEAEWFDASRGL